MSYPTTRKYPRTLNEAFPRGTEYANSIERHRRTDLSGMTIVIVVGFVLALAILGRWIGAML